jgi:dihydrofolate reductase
MRKIRYNVAASLDGFIAGPNWEYDWIPADDSIDFPALFDQFDLFLMGRKTWEIMVSQGDTNPLKGKQVLVASRTMPPSTDFGVEVIPHGVEDRVRQLKSQPGKDIWLFGGANLAKTLFQAKLVDSVEVALCPIILTRGIPLLEPMDQVRLLFQSATPCPSGIQLLRYQVVKLSG